MDLLNLLLKLNHDVFRMLNSEHHFIIFGLIAYFIRYAYGNTCYDGIGKPRTCITSPINAAQNREISATNTCGSPPEGFCHIGPQMKCELCNADVPPLNHPASFMVDRFMLNNVTWWQSNTWWQANKNGLSKLFVPLKVNITLDLNKLYLISGGIYITFKTERPKQMIIEKSRDFGKTWKVYQYFAKNCRSMYNLQPDPKIDLKDSFKETCSELYSGEFPRSGGVVHFDPRMRYEPENYYNIEVHRYLEATNIRLRLEYPGTDGREYIDEESTLNQYYYAISDLRVDARCDCNGHGEFCDIAKDGKEKCECHHFTMGNDCQECLPLYRNRKWMEGNATHANPCQKCECFDHATTCSYSAFLNQGICNDCQHNTRGIRCDQCVERYYRNVSVPLNHRNVCMPCDCYSPGIMDDGKCLQTATQNQKFGQCTCKPGIYGRKCDECVPGKWGFASPPIGTCFDCSCDIFGTINRNQICDQTSGQCTCKVSTTGRTCDTCKDGYYKFPTSLSNQCEHCPCNAGGALPSCNKLTGLCSCRTGVMGGQCGNIKPGYFFPNFTYTKYEPEFSKANGTFTWYYLVRDYAKYFTGFGYAKLDAGQEISFEFTVPVDIKYFMLLRYSLYQLEWFSQILPQGREISEWAGNSNKEFYLKSSDQPMQWVFSVTIYDSESGSVWQAMTLTMQDLSIGNAQFWLSKSSFELKKNQTYKLKIVYESSAKSYGKPWPLLLDSILFIPDYRSTSYFNDIESEKKIEVFNCFTQSKSLATTFNLPSNCEMNIFTIALQTYQKALTCNCFTAGSHLWNTCDQYGGQCQCKEGYGGRACDSCIPGYYGDPGVGCLKCACSEVGSLSLACHRKTGQCTCKENVHGMKCNECLLGFYFMSETNPKGCLECFGYGHLSSCTSANEFTMSFISSHFTGGAFFDGWKLIGEDGEKDLTSTLLRTSQGMEHTVEKNLLSYFSAPTKFLGDQLHSYGQLLVVEMSLYPIEMVLEKDVDWHLRLIGNKQTALFKFVQTLVRGQRSYTIRLHRDYMVDSTKLTEFQFKAMLGQLTALHIGTRYFQGPVTVTLQTISLHTAKYDPDNANETLKVNYVEKAKCLEGFKGFSCEECADDFTFVVFKKQTGYTRVIPGGGPLVNCVPCSCNNRSKECDPSNGVCRNCRPGTTGRYCEKCLENVREPSCDRCTDGYFGMYTTTRGCKQCDCHLPGTDGGNNNHCNTFTGQCVCNKTVNVGGRQCNTCKENSYNVSLTENLRCQECPTCYGLIEDYILEKRAHILDTNLALMQVVSLLLGRDITPFYQGTTSLRMQIHNLTIRSMSLNSKVNGLDFLWNLLGEKIELFMSTLNGTLYVKMNKMTERGNEIFLIHNNTMFQHVYIHQFLINNYYLLHNTVRARMMQQEETLNMLKNLGKEMGAYLEKAEEVAKAVMVKKYDLIQKIRLSFEAAQTSVKRAGEIRSESFNLTAKLTPVNARALQVKGYAQTCVASIDAWLKNATKTLEYSQRILRMIEITLPDHSVKINELSLNITKLTGKYNTISNNLLILSRDSTSLAHTVTNMRQMSLQSMQISFIQRTLSRYNDNIQVHRDKAKRSIERGKSVKTEAVLMLKIVENFGVAAAEAKESANEMLTKVDSVKKSVDQTHTVTEQINKQIIGPITSANTALQLMSQTRQILNEEKQIISLLYAEVIGLKTKSEDASNLIRDEQIRKYITNYLTPLITQCVAFDSTTNLALSQGRKALEMSMDARSLAEQTAAKILLLAANIDKIQVIKNPDLESLSQSIIRVRSLYANVNLNSSMEKLRKALTLQKEKVNRFVIKKSSLRTLLQSYEMLYQSLSSLSC